MLNLCRESQRCHSYKLSRENIKHGAFTLGLYWILNARGSEWNSIFWGNGSCDRVYFLSHFHHILRLTCIFVSTSDINICH